MSVHERLHVRALVGAHVFSLAGARLCAGAHTFVRVCECAHVCA